MFRHKPSRRRHVGGAIVATFVACLALVAGTATADHSGPRSRRAVPAGTCGLPELAHLSTCRPTRCHPHCPLYGKHAQRRRHDHRRDHVEPVLCSAGVCTIGETCADDCGCGTCHPTQTVRRWVEGHYDVVPRKVCVEPEHFEWRVVPAVFETRYDDCGRSFQVMVCPPKRERFLVPARWELRDAEVWVAGYWETVEVPIAPAPVHARVPVPRTRPAPWVQPAHIGFSFFFRD